MAYLVILNTRKVLGRMLTRRGHAVTAVDSGEALLHLMLEDKDKGDCDSDAFKAFSVILVDRYMPGIGGPGAIRCV